jgi:hypothetical protein
MRAGAKGRGGGWGAVLWGEAVRICGRGRRRAGSRCFLTFSFLALAACWVRMERVRQGGERATGVFSWGRGGLHMQVKGEGGWGSTVWHTVWRQQLIWHAPRAAALRLTGLSHLLGLGSGLLGLGHRGGLLERLGLGWESQDRGGLGAGQFGFRGVLWAH